MTGLDSFLKSLQYLAIFLTLCISESYIKVEESPSTSNVKSDQEHTRKEYQSVPFNNDLTYLIRANKIPWVATKMEIIEFFNDIHILNGVNGIHFIVDKTKNRSNDAFIQLASEKDYQLAMNLKAIRMGFSSVQSKVNFFIFEKYY